MVIHPYRVTPDRSRVTRAGRHAPDRPPAEPSASRIDPASGGDAELRGSRETFEVVS